VPQPPPSVAPSVCEPFAVSPPVVVYKCLHRPTVLAPSVAGPAGVDCLSELHRLPFHSTQRRATWSCSTSPTTRYTTHTRAHRRAIDNGQSITHYASLTQFHSIAMCSCLTMHYSQCTHSGGWAGLLDEHILQPNPISLTLTLSWTLTLSLTLTPSEIWYDLAAHHCRVTVLMSNIDFLIFAVLILWRLYKLFKLWNVLQHSLTELTFNVPLNISYVTPEMLFSANHLARTEKIKI